MFIKSENMKNIIFVILLFKISLYSQTFYMPPDLSAFAPRIKDIIAEVKSNSIRRENPVLDTLLNGPVKSVSIKSIKDGFLGCKVFDKKGRLISYSDVNENKFLLEYDVINRVIKKECIKRGYSEVDEVFKYFYKLNGKLDYVMLYDDVDEFERSYDYHYYKGMHTVQDDEDVEKYYYKDGSEKIKKYENWDDGELENYIEYTYDDSNRIKTILEHDVEGEYEKLTEFHYKNNKLFKKIILDKKLNKKYQILYEYKKDELDKSEYEYYVKKKFVIYTVVDRDQYNNIKKIKVNKNYKLSYIFYHYKYFN